MIKRIHVNQHHIRANAKDGGDRPVLTVKTYKSNDYCNRVKFVSGEVVHSPNKPLSCGARVWIETHEPGESSMKNVYVQFNENYSKEFLCESYGWDSKYLFLNGVEFGDDTGPETVTITLSNIQWWSRADD